MKVIIVTTDEPFYIPLTIQKLLTTSAKNYIQRIIILPPTAKKRSWRDIIFEQLRFGFFYFLYRTSQYILYKLFAKLNLKIKGRFYSVKSVAKLYNIPCSMIHNINSDEAVKIIQSDNPDIIVSISASQIFSKRVINLSRWATINVHNAPLPKYQGLMPSFWCLYYNEKFTATTVHLMTDRVDSGDIIIQKKIEILPDETLDSLIKKMKLNTVDALLEAFELFKIYQGKPPTIPFKKEEATYFGFPSKIDIKNYKKMGKKLLWKNIY